MAGRPLLVVAVLALLCDGLNGTLSRSHRDLTSPDTRCALRLDRLAELGADWMLQLPVLDNATVLGASPWATYVQGIYGPLSASDYPVDLRCFIFWWAPRLPSSQIPWFRKHFHLSKGQGNLMHHHGKLRSANHDAWKVNLYGRREDAQGSGDDRNHDAALARARFDSHERVEIYHDGSDCAGRGAVGYWMYFAPGSGIFFDLGRTMTFSGGYKHACRHFLGADDQRCRGCCRPVHEALMSAARTAGLDSLQFPDSRPGSHEDVTFEIVSVLSRCDASERVTCSAERCCGGQASGPAHRQRSDAGACPPAGLLSRGRSVRRPCTCNVSHDTVNCVGGFDGGIGVPAGGGCSADPAAGAFRHTQNLNLRRLDSGQD